MSWLGLGGSFFVPKIGAGNEELAIVIVLQQPNAAFENFTHFLS